MKTIIIGGVAGGATAAARLRSRFDGIGKMVISRVRYRRSVGTDFILPYPPINGRDRFILYPEGYGYDTDTGYLEAAKSSAARLHISVDRPRSDVTALLVNRGASRIRTELRG